jgi:hypothetical protein
MIRDLRKQFTVEGTLLQAARLVYLFLEPFVVSLVHDNQTRINNVNSATEFRFGGTILVHQPRFLVTFRWPSIFR